MNAQTKLNKATIMKAAFVVVLAAWGNLSAAATTYTFELSPLLADGSDGTARTLVSAAALAAVPAIAVGSDQLLSLEGNGTGTAMTSGGVVATGKDITIEPDVTGVSLFSLTATQNLDLYVRSTAVGTTMALFTITSLHLAGATKEVKVWRNTDLTTLTITGAVGDATSTLGSTVLEATPIPAPAQSKNYKGRTYVLSARYLR